MKVGISMIYKRIDESTPNPGAFAQECEAIGLESVWVGDHMLFHGEPKTPFPAGGPIPDHYAHVRAAPYVNARKSRNRGRPASSFAANALPVEIQSTSSGLVAYRAPLWITPAALSSSTCPVV